MGFEKGHKLATGGKRDGAGRKKAPSTVMREVMENLRGDIGGVIEALKKAGFGGEVKCPDCGRQVAYINPSVEACKHLSEMVYGKSTQKSKLEVGSTVNISALEIAEVIQRARIEFLRQSEICRDCPHAEACRNCENWKVRAEQLPVGETEPGEEVSPT